MLIMDVFSALGSIIGTTEVAGRILIKLYELKQKMTEADLTLLLLITEINSSQAALEQIHCVIEERSMDREQYFQATIDLQATLNGLQILMENIEAKIASIPVSVAGSLSLSSRVKVVLSDSSTKDYLEKLHRMLAALGILITALQCQRPEKQNQILFVKANRDMLNQVKEDSSSLLVLHDGASMVTRRSVTTTASSKYSLRFHFDNTLLETSPYQKAIRALFRRSALERVQQAKFAKASTGFRHQLSLLAKTPSGDTEPQTSLADHQGRAILDDSTRESKVKQILVVGDTKALNTLWLELIWPSNQLSRRNLVHLRRVLCDWLLKRVEAVLVSLTNSSSFSTFAHNNNIHSTLISVRYVLALEMIDYLPQTIVSGLKTLWNELRSNLGLYSVKGIFSQHELSYFLQHVETMSDPEWIPEIDGEPLLEDHPEIPSGRLSTRAYFIVDGGIEKAQGSNATSLTCSTLDQGRRVARSWGHSIIVTEVQSYDSSKMAGDLSLFRFCSSTAKDVYPHDFILIVCDSINLADKLVSVPDKWSISDSGKKAKLDELFQSVKMKFLHALEAADWSQGDLHILHFNDYGLDLKIMAESIL